MNAPADKISDAGALNAQVRIQFQRGHLQEALRLTECSLEANPSQPDVLNNQGVILQAMQRNAEALACYDKSITIKPGYADAHNNRGNVLQDLRRYDDALASYDKAIALKPNHADAHNNRGNVLHETKRYEEALRSYNQAVALDPDYADAYNNRGLTLKELQRYDDALASYDKTMALNPNHAEAYGNRGDTLQALKRHEEALANYDKAIALKPDYADAYNNRGVTLQELKRYEEALVSFEKAGALKPDIPYLTGVLLYTQLRLCQWQGVDELLDKLVNELKADKPASAPFPLVATPLSAAQQRACAEIYMRSKAFPRAGERWAQNRYSHDKIRIGYFSADFQNHATAYLMVKLFELHDRSKFEITGFSFGPPSNDMMRKRLEKAFDRFIDVSRQSDLDIATLARNLEIDIAVDLKGFTRDSRAGIFALRPAPVQVSYLGYPGTMGTNDIDYLIADPILIPKEHKCHYAEKIAYLPGSYQVNDSSRKISDKRFTRREAGLPEEGIVFCCFNKNYKITPALFDVWMRLLHKVPGSVLWLFESNASSAKNLRAEAELRGISGRRLVFAAHVDLADHLARHRLADLFLDTFYCNAHTTASDALWAGLPVLTCLGETFAGRVAGSLLHAVGLPELVTHSHAEYEARALALAGDPQQLSAIRAKLAKNRATYPLFNTALTARYLEQAYMNMWERNQAGLPPEDIYVRG